MDKKIITPKDAPAPVGPYSTAVEAGGFIFCSGQIPLDAKTGEVFTGEIGEQTRRCMANVETILKAADLKFENIVKTTIFLTDMKDFAKVNEVYGSFFKAEPPARSTVAVAGLPKGVNVEIEVLARR